MTARCDITKIEIPSEVEPNTWVNVRVYFINDGDTSGRLYIYIANSSQSPGELRVRGAGTEWVLLPGYPGVVFAMPEIEPTVWGAWYYDFSFLFPSPGTYQIIFEGGHFIDSDRVKDDEETKTVAVRSAEEFKVTLYAWPTEGYAPLTVGFMIDYTGGVEPIDFTIYYGDGTSDTITDVVGYCPMIDHTYEEPNTYEAQVLAVDSAGRRVWSNKVTITVERLVKTYTLTISVGEGGQVRLYVNGALRDIISTGTKSYDIREDERVSLYAEPGSGYDFDYWLVDGQKMTDRSIELTLAKDTRVEAYFKKLEEEKLQVSVTPVPYRGEAPLEVTFYVSWTGGTAPYDVTIDYDDGSREEKITTSTNYTFKHTYTAPKTYTVKVDVKDFFGVPGHAEATVEVYEKPPEKATLTIVGAKGGTIYYGGESIREGQTRTFSVNIGSSVTITQQSDPGYEFKWWTYDGSISMSETLTLTVYHDITVSAVFEQVTPPPERVTLTIVGATGGTIYYKGEAIRAGETKTYTLNMWDEVTLTQKADPGYVFKHWLVNGDPNPAETLGFTIVGDTTVTAVFEEATLPPTCTEGQTKCVGTDLYICQNGRWVLKEKDSPECKPAPEIDWTKILPIALIAILGIAIVEELTE